MSETSRFSSYHGANAEQLDVSGATRYGERRG